MEGVGVCVVEGISGEIRKEGSVRVRGQEVFCGEEGENIEFYSVLDVWVEGCGDIVVGEVKCWVIDFLDFECDLPFKKGKHVDAA